MAEKIHTNRTPHYCLTSKHHGGSRQWAQWSIDEAVEVDLFYLSLDEGWTDDSETVWACLDGGAPLGTDSQIIAKFPPVVNKSDPRHGYPVKPRDGNHDIPQVDIVHRWLSENRIKKRTKMRILTGQI